MDRRPEIRALGVHGGFNTSQRVFTPMLSPLFYHDAAVAVVRGGAVLAASEEERWTRTKHTNSFPRHAIRACLREVGMHLTDFDVVAFPFLESFSNARLRREFGGGQESTASASDIFRSHLSEFGPVPPLRFVDHHEAHAATAFFGSGTDHALTFVADGRGESQSTSLWVGSGGGLTKFREWGPSDSLGEFYSLVTEALGFKPFDEYKVMGLAAYGDADQYRSFFDQMIECRPGGGYGLDLAALESALSELEIPAMDADSPEGGLHADLAASLQQALERVVVHVLRAAAAETSLDRLCLSGGVMQNSSLNGSIAESGIFNSVYVPSAPNDAGVAVGAALVAAAESSPRLSHLQTSAALGGTGPDRATTYERVRRWEGVVDVVPVESAAEAAAEMIATGHIIGWYQGRAEYGPRALGNRSILADPRIASARRRINAVIKKRERFRPFAPSVLVGPAREYFDIPVGIALPVSFMSFVFPVRKEYRSRLPAITHVDGSARVHLVTPDDLLYTELLEKVRERTGFPIVLNTSFNNFAEPIVQSPEDALACFLTSELDALVMEDLVIRRAAAPSWKGFTARVTSRAASTRTERADLVSLGLPVGVAAHSASGRERAAYDPVRAASVEDLLENPNAFWRLWEARLLCVVAPGQEV